MIRVQVRALAGLILAVLVFVTPVLGDSNAATVSSALDRQEAWLATSSHGDFWNDFLHTPLLREELAKGPNAKRRSIAKVLGRYESRVRGLEQARFQTTRDALNEWANELRVPMALRWAARSRGASLRHLPIRPEQIEQAKSELTDAMANLDRFLSTSSSANAAAWKRFLKWDQLQDQLQAEGPDLAELNAAGEQYFDGHPGLELPEFVKVRNSLRKYLFLETLSGQSDDNLNKSMAAQLEALADALEKYNDAPSVKSAGKIATLLDWLDQLGRLPNLAAEIRSYHQHPNIFVQVSEDFIARRFADTVDETRPVDEMILKTRQRGNARTTGNITADVVPSSRVARIDILLQGVTNTSSVGRQKPVTIHSHSRTTVEARKSLLVSLDGVTSQPAKAKCDTSSTIFSIVPDGRFGRRLIESIAWKKAGQQKPLAEQIASRRAEERVERQMDEQSRERIEQAKKDLREKLRKPMEGRGLIPDQVATSSNDTHVFLRATQANQAQFAALGDPPPPTFATGQLVAALVHESLINNTAEQAIAGLRLTDERIAELVEEVTGSVPEELQLSDDKAPWSIAFDWQQPLTVEFDDQTMTLAVRGRSFTSGERTLNRAMEMSATYSMQTSSSGVILTRQGDIEVNFPNQREGERLSNTQIIFQALMKTKFSGLFKPEIKGEGVVLPDRWEAIGRLRLETLTTHGGWLSLGWK